LKEVKVKRDHEIRKQIMTELQILKECNHPNIIKSYGAFPTENGITIALEYMNSGSLASII